MKDFTTGWFDTNQANIMAKCNARVSRMYKEIRIDWTVLMKLKQSSDSISEEVYIDLMVDSSPDIGSDIARIKAPDTTWNGVAEHSMNGIITYEDETANNIVLKYSSISNFPSPAVFTNIELPIDYDEYNEDAAADTPMPFASIFTTEEYLDNHKGLVPRNIICYYKS